MNPNWYNELHRNGVKLNPHDSYGKAKLFCDIDYLDIVLRVGAPHTIYGCKIILQ